MSFGGSCDERGAPDATGDWNLLGKYLYQSGPREAVKAAFQKSLEIDLASVPLRLIREQFEG